MEDLREVTNPTLLARMMMAKVTEDREKIYKPRLTPSSMQSCLRLEVLGARRKLVIQQHTGEFMKSVFDKGNAAHWLFQNDPAYLGNRLFGQWECLACGHLVCGQRTKEPCSNCNARPEVFIYKEFEMRLTGRDKVSGRPDLFVWGAYNSLHVGEIKTMSGAEFAKLTAPSGGDVLQLSTYIEYMNKTDFIVKIQKSGIVIYVPKDSFGSKIFPYKMFWFTPTNTMLNLIRNRTAIFSYCIENENYIPEPLDMCRKTDWENSKAKKCVCGDHCLQLKKGKICTEEIARKGLDKLYPVCEIDFA